VYQLLERTRRLFEAIAVRWGTEEWALIAVGLVLFGFFCMKGFGSRKKY
jgi:hypothetical protein